MEDYFWRSLSLFKLSWKTKYTNEMKSDGLIFFLLLPPPPWSPSPSLPTPPPCHSLSPSLLLSHSWLLVVFYVLSLTYALRWWIHPYDLWCRVGMIIFDQEFVVIFVWILKTFQTTHTHTYCIYAFVSNFLLFVERVFFGDDRWKICVLSQ